MMENAESLVARVVEAAGGRIVGRVRLQKAFYLLDELGLGSGFSYAYHHYGPYSADLADAVDGAKAFRLVDEEIGRRASDGVPFSVYKIGSASPSSVSREVGALEPAAARRALEAMERYSATILELAATIRWLGVSEGVQNWRAELVRRKGVKTESGRTEQARSLLKELKLA